MVARYGTIELVVLEIHRQIVLKSKLSTEVNPTRRLKSAKDWSKSTGTKIYSIFDFPDQRLDIIPKLEIIQKLEQIFKNLSPDIVYTHHDGDINHDHQIVSHAVLTALRPMNKLSLKPEIMNSLRKIARVGTTNIQSLE